MPNGDKLLVGEAKCLTPKTKVFVTGKDGTCSMTFYDLCNAVRGGLDIFNAEITLDEKHSLALEQKRRAIEEVNNLMKSMNPSQAELVVAILRSNEDLMNLDEDYS